MTLKIGVIGTGVMGTYHVKNYAALAAEDKDITLSGIYDADPERAAKVAEEYGTKPFSSLQEFADNVDAASVVCPTIFHYETGMYLLSKGIPCLIEKPLAVTKSDCETLIKTAKEANVIMQVGHIELFNPAVTVLFNLLKEQKPVIYKASAFRMSPASGRITDVDVTEDLMIHDIYVIREIIKTVYGESAVDYTAATGFDTGRDFASALFRFSSKTYASCCVSRISSPRVRTLDLFTDIGQFHLDFIAQTLQQRVDDGIKDIPVEKAFSLELEIKSFINCLKNGTLPICDGEEALKSMEILWQIKDRMNT